MHDVVLVENLEGLEELPEDHEGLGLLQVVLPLEEVLESAAVAELIDNVVIVLGLDDFVVADDVLGDANGREGLDLVRDIGLQLVVLLEFLNGDHFDCEVARLGLVGGTVH